MSNPLPTFVPRKRTRAKTADAPADIPVDTDAPADVPADTAPAADPDTKDDASVDDAPAAAAKPAAPTNGLLAIEAAPNANALKDDDTSDKDVSLADDSTTSKDEVSFPSPAGDDSGNDVKAHEDASAPASEEAVAERGGEDTEPAARGVDVAANAAEEDEPVAEKAEERPEDKAEPKETAETDDVVSTEDSETHEETKDQSIDVLSADSTNTPAAAGESPEETPTKGDDESSKDTVSTENPESEPTKAQDADASELNAEPAKTSEIEDVVQERSISPVADSVQEPAPVTNADGAEDTIKNDASDAESVDDALPVDDPARDLECAEKTEDASNKYQSSDEPTEESEPAADYYHTRSPEPETHDEVEVEPTTERETSVLANDQDVPVPEEVSKSESAAIDNDNAAESETSVNSGAEENAGVGQDVKPSVPVVASEEPATVANDEISAPVEPVTQKKDTSSTAADSEHEEDKAASPLVVDDSPAPVVKVNDDVDGAFPSAHDGTATEDDKRTPQDDASGQKASEHADIDTSSPTATTDAPLEDDELEGADEVSAGKPSNVEEAPEAVPAEKTIGSSNPSKGQDNTAEADEILEESEKPVEASQPESTLVSAPADEESEPQLALSTKSVEPDEDDMQATEDADRPSGSPVLAVDDHDEFLNPTQLSATRPETEPEESESIEANAAVESKDAQDTTSDPTTKSMDVPEVQGAPKPIEVAAQADSIVEKAVTNDVVGLTRSFVDASSVAVEPTGLDKVSESAASDSSKKASEPEVVISSAASNVGHSMKDSHAPDNVAGSSTYERSVGSEPNASSPEEESFFGIPEDTALDDEADLHSGESPGTAKVSSLHGEADQSADQQPPILGNERSIPVEESHEELSRAINEPSSPLVDPDTPIPSIERDYDSSDDEADDFEADAKYEQQRSYALPEETPEPIEATTRSPAPQTATTPSVEPFIRDLDYDDEESKVEELLSTIKPQDASVELRSAERSVSSSLDAGSAQPDDEKAFSTRDLSPADSAVDKTSIPDYYNTRSRSPTRVSEKSNLDAVVGPETGHEQVQQQDRPVSPVAPEYIEDTAVKSFRDDVDEPEPAIAAGQIKISAVPAGADNLVPMPLKTRNDALAEDLAVAYDDWDTSPDASVDGESRFSSTKTPWDAAHVEHESDDMAAAGLELSDDEDEFHLESTRLRSEPAKRTYDLPSMSPTKSSYDLPSKSPTKSTYDLPSMSPTRSNHDLPSFSRAAEPASVDGYDSRESSEQPSSLDLRGRADEAQAYFEGLGYWRPPRQTTADFLTSIADRNARHFQEGREAMAPKTPEALEAAFRASEHYQRLLEDVDLYDREHRAASDPDEKHKRFEDAVQGAKSKHVKDESPYTVSVPRQIAAATRRQAWLFWGDLGTFYTKLAIIVVNALIVGSLFYESESGATSAAFSMSSAMFFSVAFIGWLEFAVLAPAIMGRATIERQRQFALYRPSAVVLARAVLDLPLILIMVVVFSLPFYFLAKFDVEAGKFFIYMLLVYVATLCLTTMYRMFAAFSSTVDDAIRFVSVFLNIMFILTGYVIPRSTLMSDSPWFGWFSYANPVAYGYEALLGNEFGGRELRCSESNLVPRGPGADADYQGCTLPGSTFGSSTVSGEAYLQTSFDFSRSNLWRNFGIMLAFTVFFLLVNVWAVEKVRFTGSSAHSLVFAKPSEIKEETSAEQQKADETLDKIGDGTSVFTFKDIRYTVPYGTGHRRLLNGVNGYAAPGKMVALMGSSGAGKTTLLNTLAQRQRVGVVSGDILVNGVVPGAAFKRGTGFCEQRDIHEGSSTVREALDFSALLRQEKHIPKPEKLAYVDRIVRLLELDGLSHALISSLTVEQRKRVTIGVELAARPSLLLFLDEPTSGLDSQSAFSIVRFLRRLADAGQAIICTIHQPSSDLIGQFDMILALNRGGNTFYFGPVGENGSVVIDYFARRGFPCPASRNVAEFILETASRPLTNSEGVRVDWDAAWLVSEENRSVIDYIDRVTAERRHEAPSTEADAQFAASTLEQCRLLIQRTFIMQWREPSYVYGRLFVHVVMGILNGFTFWQQGNDVALNVQAGDKWPAFGIMVAFAVANWALVYFFVYAVRVKGWTFGLGAVSKHVAAVKARVVRGRGQKGEEKSEEA
ncbi:hypothetical protein BN1723_003835 [Verticillium longisporum]|uniref:ABC transporter domain-containing protein n=1 Tax=Verticillium longisporum TaxID=100787 RepID=A0A0G4MD00_VERLO|nr:hypothetical protein BN1723_003835 [Verticillium longisporum]